MNAKVLMSVAAVITANSSLVGLFITRQHDQPRASITGTSNTQVIGNGNSVGNTTISVQSENFETPEKDISRLSLAHDHLTETQTAEFIKHYRFIPWMNKDGFSTYLLYNGTTDPSADPRMILFFVREGLCAVMHTKAIDLNSEAIESVRSERGYKVTFTSWCYHNEPISDKLRRIYYPIIKYSD